MMIDRALVACALALAGLLAWQVGRPPLAAPEARTAAPEARTVMMASWVDNPETLEEAVGLSEEIVLGRVVGARQARDIAVRAPLEPGGVHRIPVRTITFQLEKTYLAPAERGGRPQTVEVFQTGGSLDDGQMVLLEGDPDYRPGERYLLFLTRGPDLVVEGSRVPTRAVIAPEGRFRVARDGRLDPVSRLGRGFAHAQRGRNLETLETALARQIGRRE